MDSQPLPYGQHWIDESDIQAVVDVLRSDRVTQGPAIEAFEDDLSGFCGAKYAVAVANGTAALHLACLATGLGSEDELVTSPLTFAASANCGLYCGASPGFADIDPGTLNLSPADLEDRLGDSEKTGNRVVIPVHFGGQPCDMESIEPIARKAGAAIIEDASHALGARWQSEDGTWHRVGDCSHSDLVALSFHPVKHITTGEGGAVLTNDLGLFESVRDLRNHGIVRDANRLGKLDGPWYYEMQNLGFNYRISDLQCALGSSQLTKIESWVGRRREISARYEEAFRDAEHVEVLGESPKSQSSRHLFVILVKRGASFDRRDLYRELHERGIGAQVHYIPVHLQPYYRDQFGFAEGDFPVAEDYYRRCLSLPIYPKLTDQDVERVIETVLESVAACDGAV